MVLLYLSDKLQIQYLTADIRDRCADIIANYEAQDVTQKRLLEGVGKVIWNLSGRFCYSLSSRRRVMRVDFVSGNRWERPVWVRASCSTVPLRIMYLMRLSCRMRNLRSELYF